VHVDLSLHSSHDLSTFLQSQQLFPSGYYPTEQEEHVLASAHVKQSEFKVEQALQAAVSKKPVLQAVQAAAPVVAEHAPQLSYVQAEQVAVAGGPTTATIMNPSSHFVHTVALEHSEQSELALQAKQFPVVASAK